MGSHKKRSRSRDHSSERTSKRLRKLEDRMEEIATGFAAIREAILSREAPELEMPNTDTPVIEGNLKWFLAMVKRSHEMFEMVTFFFSLCNKYAFMPVRRSIQKKPEDPAAKQHVDSEKSQIIDLDPPTEETENQKDGSTEVGGPSAGNVKDSVTSAADEIPWELDADGLRIFGEDPAQKEPELILHSSVAMRWKKYLSEGLKKEVKDSLMEKYPRRKLAGSALAALAPAIESLAPLRDAESMKRLEQIWDAAKLLIEIHKSQTVARKAWHPAYFVQSSGLLFEKRVTDSYLFGEKLVDKVKKRLRLLGKVGEEMKSAPVKKTLYHPGPLNVKGSSSQKKSVTQTGRENISLENH
ncbi:hypothetical protein KQX54_018128 [Cotesia glomerata]|uniref:Uncharacterized protein n=1 Tax=Cotesia glomerata TaxID=32391 RepID=A0AAV7JA07_COTGL|nr:hypothetical protein KQX54_018128 [Cotesia glomerata]